jgi:hypothetical protein
VTTCDLHDGQPVPCRVCALLVPAIVSAAARELIEQRVRWGELVSPLRTTQYATLRQRLEGYTVRDLARAAGVSETHIYRMCAQGATASAILNSPRRKVGRPRKKECAPTTTSTTPEVEVLA